MKKFSEFVTNREKMNNPSDHVEDINQLAQKIVNLHATSLEKLIKKAIENNYIKDEMLASDLEDLCKAFKGVPLGGKMDKKAKELDIVQRPESDGGGVSYYA